MIIWIFSILKSFDFRLSKVELQVFLICIRRLIYMCFIISIFSCLNRMTTVEPGPVVTKFAENAKVGELDTTIAGLDEPTLNLIRKFLAFIEVAFKNMAQQGDDIAKVILEAITSSNPHARYMTNPGYSEFLQQRYTDLTGDNFRKLLADFSFGDKKE